MFKGLKKKIEGSQTVSSRKSPSRIDSKPGGPVRVSSTSEDPNETDSAQASGVHLRVSVEDKDQTTDVRNNDLGKEIKGRSSDNTLTDQLTTKDKQLSELKSVIGILEEKIADLRQEIVVCKNSSVPLHDYQAATTRADELEKKSREMQQRNEIELQEKTGCIEGLQQQIASLQTECEAQQKRVTAVEDNLEQSQQRCGSLQQELELKAASLGKVTVELQKANESVCRIQSELALSQNKNTELEELVAARDQYQATVAELQERVRLLEQRLKDTEMSDSDHLQAVLKERDKLESALSETKSQMTVLETQHREKVMQLQAQAESLTQERRMDQLSIRTLNDEVKQLQLKLSDIQDTRDRDREQYDEETAALAQRTKELASSCDFHQAERTKLAKERDELRTTLETLKEANMTASTASHAQLEELQQKHNELQQLAASRSQQIEELREVDRRKDELLANTEQFRQETEKQSVQETNRLQQSLQARHREVEILQKQVADASQVYERNITDKQRTIEELYEQVQSLESKLEQQERNDVLHQPATLSIQQYTPPEWQQQMDQLQKDKADLEEQLVEKNKALRTQQQRLTDLKKTLHRELKVQTSGDDRMEYDARDVNSVYLKNVLLKFLCSRDHEARQLVKAISTLLQFSAKEEKLIVDWLDYRTSWFGSVPHSPGIRKPSS